MSGNPTKIEYHVITELGSPYGIFKTTTSNVGTNGGGGLVMSKTTDMSTNSAGVLKSNWAALSAMLAMVVLVL